MALPRSPLVAATTNDFKFQELNTVARKFGVTLKSPAQAAQELGLGAPPEVEETALTYRENALLKAEAFYRWSGLPALADDSGLEVKALHGRPGVHSARYAGEGAPSSRRIEKLLQELAALEAVQPIDRAARFRCVLVLVRPNEEPLTSEAVLTGRVLHEPRGNGGFGYDPVIYLDAIQSTLAEVDFESVTCEKGFRALAAKQLFAELCGTADSARSDS